MDDLLSYERFTLSLLIGLSLLVVVLLVVDARVSIAGLRGKSGHHPMLSVLPIEEIAGVVTDYKAEPTRAGRLLIVLSLAGLAKPFVYLGVVGLLVCGYVAQFFIKEPQLGANGSLEEDFR